MPPQEPGVEPPPPTIVNSTELRAINLSIDPCASTVGPRPVRHSARLVPKKTGKRAAVVRVEGAGPRFTELPDDTVFEMHADADALVRSECW